MPRIRLFGSGPEKWIDVPLPPSQKGNKPPPHYDIPPPGNNQRATFAALRELSQRFTNMGISKDNYWSMIKSELDIESRTEIHESTYAVLSAELNHAKRDQPAFQRMVKRIRNHKENENV